MPTEPELIPQEPVPAAPVKETEPVEKPVETAKLTPIKPATTQKTVSSEAKSTSNNNNTQENADLKKKNQILQRDVVNLQSQLKSMREKLNSASAQSTVATPLQGEDPATVKKVMIILFVIAFILGWMVSSFFCKSC